MLRPDGRVVRDLTGVPLSHLTAFSLPEDGRLWTPRRLALKSHGASQPDHLVPRPNRKHWRHWSVCVRVLALTTDTGSKGFTLTLITMLITLFNIQEL